MDNARIVHITTEAALFAAMAFYFNNQNKILRNEIKELRVRLEETLDAYGKHYNNIYSMLDQLHNQVQHNRPLMNPQMTEQKHTYNQVRNRHASLLSKKPRNKPQNQEEDQKFRKQHTTVEEEQSFSSDTNDENRLDMELGDELNELEEEKIVIEDENSQDEENTPVKQLNKKK